MERLRLLHQHQEFVKKEKDKKTKEEKMESVINSMKYWNLAYNATSAVMAARDLRGGGEMIPGADFGNMTSET
jgi:hypothetical protein